MSVVLLAAAIFNGCYGLWMIARPQDQFQLFGLAAPGEVQIWQFAGLAAVVFGGLYGISATDPFRHWPAIAAGIAMNAAAAGGLLWNASKARLPRTPAWISSGWALAWCVPFALILWRAYAARRQDRITASPEIQKMALRARTQYGVSLLEMSKLSPLLLVFLRHRGCMFCREAIADVARQQRAIQAAGVHIAFVHMGCDSESEEFFRRNGMTDVPRVSDPGRTLYRAFGLRRCDFLMFLSPRVWWRGVQAAIFRRHGFALFQGDLLQMPGVFLIFHGSVLRSYRHRSIADRPDYAGFCGDQSPEPIAG